MGKSLSVYCSVNFSNTLRSTLPKIWKGSCARVQAVTEVVLIPPLKHDDTSLGGNNIGRQKRAYTPDPEMKSNKIGQPRGIPYEYKAGTK